MALGVDGVGVELEGVHEVVLGHRLGAALVERHLTKDVVREGKVGILPHRRQRDVAKRAELRRCWFSLVNANLGPHRVELVFDVLRHQAEGAPQKGHRGLEAIGSQVQDAVLERLFGDDPRLVFARGLSLRYRLWELEERALGARLL